MLPVRYFPTAAAGLSSKAMLVGGLTTGGNTVIEVWALEWPTPMPAPSTNISTGLTTVAVALPSLAQVVRLYDADVPGQRLVRNLCMVRPSTGNPTSCLVQFHDSSDIYQIALESGSMSLIASPSSSHGSLGVVPGLMPSNHYSIHVADHGVAGFVYTLVRGIKLAPVPSPSSPPIVLLLDGNRDGTLDSFLHVSHVDYQSQGWNDLNNYTSWWLN